jgi:hypothetical protein
MKSSIFWVYVVNFEMKDEVLGIEKTCELQSTIFNSPGFSRIAVYVIASQKACE